MKESAYAKINLALDVVRKREDGYHEMKMIMVPIDFYDLLEMEVAEEASFSLNRSYIPVNNKNTVIKAIEIMRERYGFTENFACKLTKHIPTQAGLAGGSADAAAAIRMINRMLKLHMSDQQMLDIGKQVGADVPFCILNRPALVQGIGEKLTLFTCNTEFELLLVKPRKGVSTKTAFANLDYEHLEHPDCDRMMDSLRHNDYDGVIDSLGNSLESVSLKMVKDIREIKEDLLSAGFDGALMSGSGSTVFGITRDRGLVLKTAEQMKRKGYFVRATRIHK